MITVGDWGWHTLLYKYLSFSFWFFLFFFWFSVYNVAYGQAFGSEMANQNIINAIKCKAKRGGDWMWAMRCLG